MITGDFRSAVHAAAQDPRRVSAVVAHVTGTPDASKAAMLQYAREALRATPMSGWDVLAPSGHRARALWDEVSGAIELALEDHERIARVVWLLWEHHTDGEEWEALRDHTIHELEGAHVGHVELSDIVSWMTAGGAQEVTPRHGEPQDASPNALFRGGWAWCILQVPRRSPCVYDETFQAWPNDFGPEDETAWAISIDLDDTWAAELDESDESWPHERDTTPLPDLPDAEPEVTP